MGPERQNLKPGQESVWDYPRPPRVEPTGKRLRVIFNGEIVAETRRGLRVLETSLPPSYYFPPADVRWEFLKPTDHWTVCEWKGTAQHFALEVRGARSDNAAWCYPEPVAGYGAIRGYVAFYPARVDACFVDEAQAQPQEERYYGGWITPDVIGPFKGAPGTEDR